MKLLLRFLVRLGIALVLVLLLAMALLHWYQPSVPLADIPAPKPVSGAAFFYNQAFAAMPSLRDEEKKRWESTCLGTELDGPLDTNALSQFVAKYDASLQLLAQGTAQPQCEWGLDPSPKGEGNPYLLKSMALNRALVFRIRLRLATGNVAGATEDILLLFRFARHLDEPTLALCYLVQISHEMLAINLITRHLQEFDESSLVRLSEGIAALPSSHSTREVIAHERELWSAFFYNQFAHQLLAAQRAQGAQASPFPAGKEGENLQPPVQEVKITGGWAAKYYAYSLKRYEQKSRELERLMTLPYVEARPQFVAFETELNSWWWNNGPVARICLANVGVRLREVQMKAAWAILHTALDAQMHGPSGMRAQLAKLRDPYDGGPIEMQEVERGVKLVLKSGEGKKPITVTIGLAKEGGL